ncbi:MAG: hypothetical protein RIQ52_462, partial [Pseudomonadota bacterium]
MDKLDKIFFKDPATHGKAIELLRRYEDVENADWATVEAFLSELETDEKSDTDDDKNP